MLDLARKLQEEKYPDLEKGGRKGKEVINLDFARFVFFFAFFEKKSMLELSG